MATPDTLDTPDARDALDAPDPLPEGLRVLVAASDPLVRRTLLAIVEGRVAGARGSSASRDDLAAEVRALAIDVVLWDLGPDGARVADRLDAQGPVDAPVIALVPEAAWARAALAWGARGLLSRDVDAGAVEAALRAVARGLAVIEPAFLGELMAAEPAVEAVAGVAPGPGETLTAREREVLQLVAEGFSNKLAAQRLGISEHTVKFHVNAVMVRLGAQSRTEAVVRAARRGLLSL